jgi:hypothetical protein
VGPSGCPVPRRSSTTTQLARILGGEQFITPIPDGIRQEIADRHITRLVKGDDGQASFETIDDPANVIKLAARSGALDLAAEFGIDPDRVAALGWSTQLAIGAGVDALRDAGIPIVQHYRTTGVGSQLPDRWGLPEDLRDDTGVIFASAFPGMEEITDEVTRYEQDAGRRRSASSCSSSVTGSPRPRPTAPPSTSSTRSSPRSTGGSTTRPTCSTGGSCSGCCRWGTRSSPS